MAVITSDDVIKRFRSDVDDALRGPDDAPDVDSLWSIDEVNGFLEDAVDRVAAETLSEFRTFTIPVTANEPFVSLPSSMQVLDIERAYMKTARRSLLPQNVDTPLRYTGDYGSPFSIFHSEWETVTGTPRHYVRDERPNALRLVPIPTANDTLEITAKTIPAFTAGGALPFSTLRDRHLVVLWMKKLAYEKRDADTFDPTRASKFEAEYESRMEDRKYEAQRVRRAVQPVRFSW